MASVQTFVTTELEFTLGSLDSTEGHHSRMSESGAKGRVIDPPRPTPRTLMSEMNVCVQFTFPYLVEEKSEISAAWEASTTVSTVASHLHTSDLKRFEMGENSASRTMCMAIVACLASLELEDGAV
jgi:hypothetical protein